MQLVFGASLVLSLVVLLNACVNRRTLNLKMRKGLRKNTIRLMLDSSVMPHIGNTMSNSIANMFLSPWEYRNSYNASRLPERISHAHCLTSGCLSLPGGGEDSAFMAKPIYYQTLVLHRVQRKGPRGPNRRRYVFRLGMEEVAVGCTCVRPCVLPSQ